MSINFELIENELILCYTPDYGIENMLNQLEENNSLIIKSTFDVNKENRRFSSNDYDDTLYFSIGEVEGDYIRLSKTVFDTENIFYFNKAFRFNLKVFVAYQNISILNAIDDVINHDFYVGGEWDRHQGISEDEYLNLIKTFPNRYELKLYTKNRISLLLKENFPEAEKHEIHYDRYIRNKTSHNNAHIEVGDKTNLKIDLQQFRASVNQLDNMLNHSEQFANETVWQIKIKDILRLIYPKYILFAREITFDGVGEYNKRPDYVLVDDKGYIDILEIKKPDVDILTKQASYRNNYVPVRELAGAVQQIEKYIFCLNTLNKGRDKFFQLLSDKLPEQICPQIVNPQGMLLIGRSKHFNQQQNSDFELIKRQYKNIVDIFTYDDLLDRLKNIVAALDMQLE